MKNRLFDLFRARFATDLAKPFLIHGTGQTGAGQISFGQALDISARMATVLRDNGVQKGDRIVVQVEKSAQNVMLYLACLRIGAVYVPLNPAYTLGELGYFIQDTETRLIVCDPEDEKSIAALGKAGQEFTILTLDQHGNGGLVQATARATVDKDVTPCTDDDIAAILYTSGTTGRSKGAMLTHANLASNALVLHDYWQWKPGDVLLHALPVFHVHGLFVALHCAMLNGSTVLFHSRFSVENIIRDLPKATVMMGVPTFYTRLLDQPDFNRQTCANMRLFLSGSAPLLPETFSEFQARTGHILLERYGMTEAGMITSNPYNGERVESTVGFALPGVAARVADNAHQEITRGEVGILEIKGPNVFAGYWEMPEKTAEEFTDDGYFITGDMAMMDETGRISIVGRAKDLIISGGLNIYPKEVETLIDQCAGVKESAVIGVPDADFGESVAAIVVCQAGAMVTEAQILASLKDKLAKFKRPKVIKFVPELPRNAMGKVQKKMLRETV